MSGEQGVEPKLETEPVPVTLLSADGKVFEIAAKVARVSPTIERLTMGHDRRLSLPTIRSKTLGKVIEFAEKIAYTTDSLEVDLSWVTEFFAHVDPTSLTCLILAASYLEMDDLLHLACERTAEVMAGRTPEEVQKLFSLKPVLTPAEEAKVRERNKNKWAFD